MKGSSATSGILYESTIIRKTMENGSFGRICKTGEHIQTLRIL